MNFFSKAASFVEEASEKIEQARDLIDGGDDGVQQEEQHEQQDGDRSFAQQSEEAIPAVVRMFSGCKDAQTSADVYDVSSFGLPEDSGPGGAGGACTNALMKCLLEDGNTDLSWLELLQQMRTILKTKGYSQIPELSTSRQLDLDEKFSILNGEDGGGNKKALLIGINYVGQQGELRGCHNDVKIMKEYIETQGFDNIKVLMDDGEHENPTRDNIIEAFQWLEEGAQAGDSLFMHYSGHGGSVRDTSGDEKDNMDETMIPVDYQSNGMIKDDVILADLLLDLPRGSQLTVVMDCCHSGTILDLPYIFVADDSAMDAISGGAPHEMTQNDQFDFAYFLKVGKMLFSMHQQGKSRSEIAQTAFKELYRSGALNSLRNSLGSMGLGK